MDVLFANNKLQKTLNDDKELIRVYGSQQAVLIKNRLTRLSDALNLAELRQLPQIRCHELVGNRKGQLSIDLKHPYRLILEVANEPVPTKADGGLDWASVTSVRILEIVDYH